MKNKVSPLQQAQESMVQIRIPISTMQEQFQKTKAKQEGTAQGYNQPQAQQSKPKEFPVQQKACKICLEQGVIIDDLGQHNYRNLDFKILITPCLCNGSIGFVHKQCIVKWIHAQLKRKQERKIYCQICHSRVHYDVIIQNQFVCDMDYFLGRVRSCHIASFLFILTAITTIATLLNFPPDIVIITEAMHTVSIIVLIILSFSFLVNILLVIRECCMTKKKIIQHVYTHEEWHEITNRTHRSMQSIHESVRSIQSRTRSNVASRRSRSLHLSTSEIPASQPSN